MKHYELNFVDRTMEIVGADDLPPIVIQPLYKVVGTEQGTDIVVIPEHNWWTATKLDLDAETQTKLVPHGRIHINLRNITFIKEV